MKIGSVEIKGKVFLAPMCDVTNLPFRLVCKKYGAAVVYTEMIFADAYLFENKKTFKRAKILDIERPVGVQLVGSSIEKLVSVAKKVEKEIKPDLIDINFGCPAYNVIKTGSGSAILQDFELFKKIVFEISNSINIPLTCKMRILKNDSDTVKAAKIIQDNGAKALAVHGRTARQGYTGKANWEIIKKIKSQLKIPVILNGDVVDEKSAKVALSLGVDAVMIGRAAIGNPYIFKKINHYFKTGTKLNESNLTDKINVLLETIELCKKHDYLDVINTKILTNNAVKGYEKSKEIKRAINQAKSVEQIEQILYQNLKV